MTRPPIDVPIVDVDYYGREALIHPARIYEQIREPAPVVWLARHSVLAVARFDPLREMLKDGGAFISSRGVSMNEALNRALISSEPPVLVTDGERHARLRKILIEPMRPRALEAIRPELEREAHACIDPLVGRGPIEAMSTLASHLPTTIVSRMVGLPERARGKMLLWSKATFNGIGPLNLRALRSFPAMLGMLRTQRTLHPDEVRPGTWFERLFALRDAGELTDGEARGMFLDYVAPSLDTTIFATGHLLNRLARHPEAWEALRADRSLVAGAVDESLRIDSVIRSFTRVAGRDAPLAGVTVPAGQRVVACYGGANRDPRRYADPDAFDITRDARDHLAFGHGRHACAGTRLARLEMETLLHALLDRVGRLEADAPTISMNNTLHGFSRLPLTLRG